MIMKPAIRPRTKISKECLGLAAEYAVASELCKRNIYAQLTLGNRKRADILAEIDEGGFLRIEVKGQQGGSWPNCVGIHRPDTVLVLVDLSAHNEAEMPAFYILTAADWRGLLERELAPLIAKGEVIINQENVPIWPRQKGYTGCGIAPSQVLAYKDQWEKITTV